LSGYEILRQLGRGSMSTVYLARQTNLGREVAIKQMAGMWLDSEQLTQRFMIEGRALAHLQNPNVVSVYDLVLQDPEVFLVMEYVAGPTLQQLIDLSDIPAAAALDIIRQLVNAVAYINDKGIVHRDIKPANVLVTVGGQCKLADFGIAKLLSDGDGNSLGTAFRTRTGTTLGSPAYISPEAARGTQLLDHRADLYSVGVLAFELLVGRRPFIGMSDYFELLEAHMTAPPPTPRSLQLGFPASVETVLLRALQKDPARRQRSVRSFWVELEEAANTEWPNWKAQADVAGLVTDLGVANWSEERPLKVNPDATVHRRDALAPDGTVLSRHDNPDATIISPSVKAASIASREKGDDPVSSSLSEPLTSGAPPNDTSPPPRVDVQVFEPKPRHRVSGLLIAGVVGVGLGLLVLLLLSLNGGPTRPFAVSSVSLDVAPVSATGHCPRASFTFSAHIETNGQAGSLRFAWKRPDGVTTPPQSVSVPAHVSTVVETLAFTYRGTESGSGAATVRVMGPTNLSSLPVDVKYDCP
jgi:serine/threonine protein kinase